MVKSGINELSNVRYFTCAGGGVLKIHWCSPARVRSTHHGVHGVYAL
jgi:hypothetical protein